MPLDYDTVAAAAVGGVWNNMHRGGRRHAVLPVVAVTTLMMRIRTRDTTMIQLLMRRYGPLLLLPVGIIVVVIVLTYLDSLYVSPFQILAQLS